MIFLLLSGIGIVGFEVSAMGGRSGIGGFVVVFAEGKVETLCYELACLLGFAAKAVEGPLLRGRKALFQRDDFVESLDAMQGQRFAQRFGEHDVAFEPCCLNVDACPTQFVQSAFADGNDLWMVCPFAHALPQPLGISVGCVPGMQACGIGGVFPELRLLGTEQPVIGHIDDGRQGRMEIVCVEVQGCKCFIALDD